MWISHKLLHLGAFDISLIRWNDHCVPHAYMRMYVGQSGCERCVRHGTPPARVAITPQLEAASVRLATSGSAAVAWTGFLASATAMAACSLSSGAQVKKVTG